MNEKQADRIIELLSDISSKLDNIESNTYELTNFSSELYVLDKIKELLETDIEE